MEGAGWEEIPDVLLLSIYSLLPFRDKISASSTCKHWRDLLFHPCNWSNNITFHYNNHQQQHYRHSHNDNNQRENFLKTKTAHFLNICSIQLPIEQELFVISCDAKRGDFRQENFSDVQSLMHYLCYNKNLNQVTIVQSEPPSLSLSQPSLDYLQQLNDDKDIGSHENDLFSNNNGILVSTRSGVITRSNSKLKRRKNPICAEMGNPMHEHTHNCYADSTSALGYYSTGDDGVENVELEGLFEIECGRKYNSKFSLTMPGMKSTRMQLIDYIKRIISSANSLSHLSIGCLPSLTQHNNGIVESLKQYQSCSMKSLHISRCQESMENVYQPINLQDLLMLKSLQHLSLDTGDLSDQLLVSLTEGGRAKLASLSLTMFKHNEGRRQIRDRTWDLVQQSFPDLVLTLNLVRCREAIRDMMTVINPSMPLTHLRILFCDEFYVSGLHHVARHQAPTLESLQIIESMREGPMYYDIGVDEQDPFVMMAWRCKKLSFFSVIGVALREHDVLAVARLRGMHLTKFEVLEECITAFDHGESEFEEDFSMSFETFCEEISTSLGQAWTPRTEDDVDDSIYYESAECRTFLPILMKDQQSQLLS